MQHSPTLLILAAGMGSRYGGLKQLDPLGPSGQTIMDYSVQDALSSGFGKIVFVIRRDFEVDFRDQVLARYADQVTTEVVFQDTEYEVPAGFDLSHRTKPWGTAHAVLCAREVIDVPFAVINADDYYGREAFQLIGTFLQQPQSPFSYAMPGYRLAQTLSENGAVNRGICICDPEGRLIDIFEGKNIRQMERGIFHFTRNRPERLKPDTLVSMNFFGFQPSVFDVMGTAFSGFVEAFGSLPTSELNIPAALSDQIRTQYISLAVLPTESRWFGVTYPADREAVQQELAGLIGYDFK